MIDEAVIRLRYDAVWPLLDERGRRRFATVEAQAAGRGGILAVSRITGVARSTIGRGLKELRGGSALDLNRARRHGGGRKALTVMDASLLDDLRALVDPATRGEPYGSCRDRPQPLSSWHQGPRPRDGNHQHQPKRVPW
jgi:hypothetical protein